MLKKIALVLAVIAALGIAVYVSRTFQSGPSTGATPTDARNSIPATFSAVGADWSPEAGVREAVAEPIIAWLAVAPAIDIDADYERELGEDAKRNIPIRIGMLNNSYEPRAFQGTVDDPLWRVVLKNDTDITMHEWVGGVAAEEFGPAERREVIIPWDGRDANGDLLSPARYRLRFTSAPLGNGRRLEAELPFEINDTP